MQDRLGAFGGTDLHFPDKGHVAASTQNQAFNGEDNPTNFERRTSNIEHSTLNKKGGIQV